MHFTAMKPVPGRACPQRMPKEGRAEGGMRTPVRWGGMQGSMHRKWEPGQWLESNEKQTLEGGGTTDANKGFL